VNAPPAPEPGLPERFDRPGPRYTSYPTADRFVETWGPAAYRAAAARRNTGGARRPLALYVHLPFCRDICYYCACNKIVTRDRAKSARYLDYLEREIDLQGQLFRDEPGVARMHWGGGTPTFYELPELERLWSRIALHFDIAGRGDHAIEIDPRTVDAEIIAGLRATGFSRVSFGVQDFDPRVQAAVHRLQSEALTLSAIAAARRAGFASINVDLIYGLPRQTGASLEATLDAVAGARPDRIALYNYAHLPARFKSQRRILQRDLPSPQGRLALFALAQARLAAAGYVGVGMDHFALPDDALALAQRRGRLTRDFQGYTAGEDCDLVGLGVSAIGAIGATYSQNFRELEPYYRRLDERELPIARGIELTAEDLLRRAVIQSLMCQFELAKPALEIAYLVEFDRHFATELAALRELEALGLVDCCADRITVTAQGRPYIRAICMIFDRYLRDRTGAAGHSRVI
jgi:oxygen-independent coproporphyrinogen-3 oxidase